MVATIGDPARARSPGTVRGLLSRWPQATRTSIGTDGVLPASDIATWVAVGVAIGAAALALLASLVVLLVVVGGRRSSNAAVEQLLRESLERTEGLHGGPRRGARGGARRDAARAGAR